jgi:hypothetical protein
VAGHGDVRIVEDVIIEEKGKRPVVKGTKVRSDVLGVSDDTLFPLQGALGYEVTQSLFIGPNTWLVEGPSDILHLQVLSHAQTKRKREGLSDKWTLCPSGGGDRQDRSVFEAFRRESDQRGGAFRHRQWR